MSEHDLDLPALQNYVQQALPALGKVLSVEKFVGGQSNPTYKLIAESGEFVLRRKPSGVLLPSAHAIEREYQVLQALHDSDIPVAKPIHNCADASVIGAPFYLMSFVAGRVFWNPALPECQAAERAQIYQEISAVMGRMHRLDPSTVGLGSFGKPGDYFARQLKRWSEQYRQSQTEELPAMDQLMELLQQRMPSESGARIALVHGDFRIDNLMFHPTEPKIIAIMDWELSTLGDGLADASYFCMALRLPKNPNLPGLAGMDRAALGIPSESQWLASYCQSAGVAVNAEQWPFCLAFNFFRLAAIAQGVKKRSQQGNASNTKASEVGAMVGLLAGLGLETLR
jgi:aminoglycoside phosphotransferase (APT) family kinase protein